MHGMKWLHRALLPPKPLSRSVTWLLLLGLAIAWAAYGPAALVNAQGGFISIDCGASQANNSGGISWVPDSNYIVLGSNFKINNAILPYDTLRYFPNKTINKNCYVFNTTATLPYLVRAGFLYEDYDHLWNSTGLLPSFDLLFGPNLWTTVSFNNVSEIVSHEMIVLATGDTASVCVARSNTSSHDPFISSLEIRPLSTDKNMYSTVHQNFLLKTNSRINFGQNNNDSVRYPDDEYDRIWDSDLKSIDDISKYQIIVTNKSVTSTSSLNSPPSKVMQTARGANKTENMTFNFVANFGPGQYYLAFYFAEVYDGTSQQIMDMYIDGHLRVSGLNVSALNEPVEIYTNNYTVGGQFYNLLLMPNESSSTGPILNAAESYFLQPADQGTLQQDVQALENIKTAFNLTLWTGDPCLPSDYKWSWLDCNNTTSPTRVIALNLSSRGLNTEIPSAIANLSALTSVDLHNNSLFGSIPKSLETLKNLTLLDLSDNNLSGEYLGGFSNATTVRTTGNPGLCNTSCEVTPTPVPAPTHTPASSKKAATGVIIGLVLAGFLVLVMVVLGFTLHRCKSQKKRKLRMINSAHWPPVPPFTEISRARVPVVGEWTEGTNDVPIYSFADMQTITNNFEKKLAAGSFGSLFYGALSGGQEVVVKLLHSNFQQSPTEFLNTVTRLSCVHHRNLLRPIGFCAESHRLMFVYEHVQKGSLYDHLYSSQCLDWRTRLNILQQVAQGLEYLHYACSPSIVHGNLKSTNVLMSGDGMLAKVSDFGIYELSPNVDATSGYLDPEYFVINKLTEKSDVYSFGVLILEVVCGRVPLDTSIPKAAWNIVDWVQKGLHIGNYELIADPFLHGSYNMTALSKVLQLAFQATESNINERPTMTDIVMELKEANKIELCPHVAFAELATSDFSNNSDLLLPLPSTFSNGSCEDDVSH